MRHIASQKSQLPMVASDFVCAAMRKKFSSKATIVGQGGKSRDLFLILRGSVTFRLETPSGHDLVLGIAHAGEFFGETGLFETAALNTWWVRARGECEVAYISHAALEKDSALLVSMWPTLTAQLAARLDRQEKKAGEMAFCDAQARVLSALHYLAGAPDAKRQADGFAISVTRVELASMSAVSREAVGRILTRLDQQGIISVKGRAMVLPTARDASQAITARPAIQPRGVFATA